MRTRNVSWIASVAFASLVGCAVFASHDDMAAYRSLRNVSETNERLVALADYAQRFPSGTWISEVQAERRQHEDSLWASGNATADGLNFYLRAYPDGQYVDLAQQRLAALGTVSERREVEAEHTEELQAERAADAAERRRQWVTTATQFWARVLVGIRNYGQPISQVAGGNPEFNAAFAQEPRPLCTPDHCIKHYHAFYAVPNPGGTRIERTMEMYLRLRLVRGRVERVEVLLPNKGFSRWYELENRTLVTDEDPEQRQQAIEWALGRLEPVFAEAASGARPIDVIPEPIDPISSAEQAASARPEESDTEAPGEPPPETSGGDTGSTGSTDSGSTGSSGTAEPPPDSLEALLSAAAGSGGTDSGAGTGETQAETTDAPAETLVLPIGLRALQLRNVRIVIFAAGDEDYGSAYDGFYIERIRD